MINTLKRFSKYKNLNSSIQVDKIDKIEHKLNKILSIAVEKQ
jgi:hypothetical protein